MTRTRRRRSKAAERTVMIRLGPFLLAFIAVLGLGGAAIAGWWWSVRGPSGSGIAEGSAVAQPTQRPSFEIGAHFTAEGDPAVGRPEAPVTVVEYGDFLCPNCAQFANEVLPWLRQTWIADGVVRVVYRDFAIRGEDSFRAAQAAHCAGDQGRYWTFHDALFSRFGEEGLYRRESLAALAESVGLDGAELLRCVTAGTHRDRVAASTDAAHELGFEGTPTYLINGRQTAGAIPIADWEALFRAYMQDLGLTTQPAPGAAP